MSQEGANHAAHIAGEYGLSAQPYLTAPAFQKDEILLTDADVSVRNPARLDEALRRYLMPVVMLETAIAFTDKTIERCRPPFDTGGDKWRISGKVVCDTLKRFATGVLTNIRIEPLDPSDEIFSEDMYNRILPNGSRFPAIADTQLAFSVRATHNGKRTAAFLGIQLLRHSELPDTNIIGGKVYRQAVPSTER